MEHFDHIINICLSIIIYFVFALAAAKIIKKTGGNLKDFKNRVSVNILLIGAVGNILILVSVLFLLKFFNKQPINSLGVEFSFKRLIFSAAIVFLNILSAVIFNYWLKHKHNVSLKIHSPFNGIHEAAGLIMGIIVLFIVAAQEEILFRGYITLNLLTYGVPAVIIISAFIFAAIHIFTNKVSFYQFISWLWGGAVFSYVYLVTGSIWVPIIFHFAIDINNMLLFNIAGKYSFVTISPAISDKHRAVYKTITSLITMAILISFYGMQIRIN